MLLRYGVAVRTVVLALELTLLKSLMERAGFLLVIVAVIVNAQAYQT